MNIKPIIKYASICIFHIYSYIYIYDYDREIERERFIKEKEIIRYLFICLYFLLFIRLR